eukprot:CAMPEP_0180146918 /NCGR_PEP_ID=MMETSP0986-20121125/18887_1 /TAXON_ID=697907 /ORGANISM="non described non described, Strain CCMP2293" /LENGTH=37 /DNA_ID= /DNA_START= /DNA_END= /DNA_ORIENTATION=
MAARGPGESTEVVEASADGASSLGAAGVQPTVAGPLR